MFQEELVTPLTEKKHSHIGPRKLIMSAQYTDQLSLVGCPNQPKETHSLQAS